MYIVKKNLLMSPIIFKALGNSLNINQKPCLNIKSENYIWSIIKKTLGKYLNGKNTYF